MSEARYGADVRYVTCLRDELNTVPILDGQIITFYDEDGFYYDMGGSRRGLKGFTYVNKLPDSGSDNIIYVTKDSETTFQMYIYLDSKFVPLINNSGIGEEAPKDGFYYQRVNGAWKFDEALFIINEDWSTSDAIKKLQKFINDARGYTYRVSVQGNLHNIPIGTELDVPLQLDFTNCVIVNDTTPNTTSQFLLRISNSAGVTGLEMSNVQIQASNTMEDKCMIFDRLCLTDSRIDLNGCNCAMIKHCKFNQIQPSFPAILNILPSDLSESRILISDNIFNSWINGLDYAIFLDSRCEYVIDNNIFIHSIPMLRRRLSTYSFTFDTHPGDLVIPHSMFLEDRRSNTFDLFVWDFADYKYFTKSTLKSLCAIPNAENLFTLGNVIACDQELFGVAEANMNHIILEYYPNVNYTNLSAEDDHISMKLGNMIDLTSLSIAEISNTLSDVQHIDIPNMLDLGHQLEVYRSGARYKNEMQNLPQKFKNAYLDGIIYRAFSIQGNIGIIEKLGIRLSTEHRFQVRSIETLQNVDFRYIIDIEKEG